MKTPLRFQVTEFDCGTTAVLNALSFLFERDQIPAELIHKVYTYTLDRYSSQGKPGEGGTSPEAMHLLVQWLNQYSEANQFPLGCKHYLGNQVTSRLISKTLTSGGVALAQVHQTNPHYVLVTGMDDNVVYLFDPYYFDEKYYDEDQQVTIVFDQLFHHNRQVARERFFSQGKKDFALGLESGRELITFSKTN